MNPLEKSVYRPQMPPLPPPHQAVLIRAAAPPSRQAARRELRTVLRRVLAFWSGLLPEQLPLLETPRGPVWPGQFAGQSLGISLSYCGSEGWIGLFRGGAIGVDAMPAASIPEAEEVARHYLGPVAWAEIQRSQNPARAFALAWTNLEARLKCLKRELTEWAAGQDAAFQEQAAQSQFFDDGIAVTIATAPVAEKYDGKLQNNFVAHSAPARAISRVY